MTKDECLLNKLADACSQGASLRFRGEELGLLEALDDSDKCIEASMDASISFHQLQENLQEAIVNDPRFPSDKVLLLYNDQGGMGFYPHFVAAPLLRCAIETSPELAISWLEKVLATDSATGKVIHALWGVAVENEIQLLPTVRLVPIDDIPDCHQKRELLATHRRNSIIWSALHFQQPQAALIVSRTIQPLVADEQVNSDNKEYFLTEKLLEEITLALTLIGPCVSLPCAQWFLFDDPDIEKAAWLRGRRGKFIEILPIRNTQSPPIDGVEAAEIVAKYLAVQGDDRNKLRVAIQRLSQALRRQDVGDRAVELATALEALLGDNGKTEMTHKIKVRFTRILGGTESERRLNADIIKQTYEIRSSMVHTGSVNTKKKYHIGGSSKLTAIEVVELAVKLCATLTKTIIRRGSIPDWQTFDVVEQIQGE